MNIKLNEGSWYLVERGSKNEKVVLAYTSDHEEAYFDGKAFGLKCNVTVISEMVPKDSVDYSKSIQAHENLHDAEYSKVIQEEMIH